MFKQSRLYLLKKNTSLTTMTDILADLGDIYLRSIVVFWSSKVGFKYILVDVKTKEKSHKNLSSYGFWRRARDSNPRTGYSPLHDFQSCSFDQLGQLSVSAIKCLYIIYDLFEKIKCFFNFIYKLQKNFRNIKSVTEEFFYQTTLTVNPSTVYVTSFI